MGPGTARNRGVSESEAPYLAFLDADDEWLPSFLRRSIELFTSNPDCVVVVSNYYVGPGKKNKGDQFRKYGLVSGPWELRTDIEQRELACALGIFHTCSVVYRRTIVEKYGGYYSKDRCSYGEDVYLWVQVMLNEKIYRNLEPLAWYHTEDAELGMGHRTTDYPLEPCFTDPDQLYRNCHKEYRPILERWLAIHAIPALHWNIDVTKNMGHVKYLLDSFPMIKQQRYQYLKIKAKISFPRLYRFLRKATRFVQPTKARRMRLAV